MRNRPPWFAWFCRLLLISLSSSLSSPADGIQTVWGLEAGDRFVVNVLVVKETEVTLSGEAPTISDTRDEFEIEYQVTEVMKTGDIVVSARIRKAVREVGQTTSDSIRSSAPSARSLEDIRIGFVVDSEGHITSINARDKENLLGVLLSLDSSTSQLLRNTCPDEIIISWFGRPFWTASESATTAENPSESESDGAVKVPERKDTIAVGPFGVLKTHVQLATGAKSDGPNGLVISATGRFIPLVVPSTASTPAIRLANVTAELDEFSGKARLSQDESRPFGSDIYPRNPSKISFLSMILNVRLHGVGTIPATAGREAQKVEFRQTQLQSWALVEQSSARPEMLFDLPTPIDRVEPGK